MRCGKSLLIASRVGALLALLASTVGASEIGVCPPYSKTFGPEDPPEQITAFINEINLRPGGGTVVLEPGTYEEPLSDARISISGIVCVRSQDEAKAHISANFDVEPRAFLTLRALILESVVDRWSVMVRSDGTLFTSETWFDWGASSSGLENAGLVFAEGSLLPHTFNTGFLAMTGGGITDAYGSIGLENSGYALLHGVRVTRTQYDGKDYGGAGIVNGSSGIVSLVRSTVAYNGICCWYADACGGGCGDGGILNTEGGYVEISQSIVARNTEGTLGGNTAGDCFGPVTDLGYNVFGPGGGCTMTAPTSIEADPWFPSSNTYRVSLDPGSPAIDLIPLDECPAVDSIGNPRTDGNGDGIVACDAGALEFSGQGVVVKAPPFARDYGLVDLSTDTALYVVFMSSAALDPATIDAYSVVLGDMGAVPRAWSLVDRNGDGVLDLRLRYKLKDVPLVCGEQTLTVSAVTTEGESVSGLLKLEVTGCTF